MRKAGVSDRVIMRFPGGKTLRVLDRYDRIDLDDLVEPMNKTATKAATSQKSNSEGLA